MNPSDWIKAAALVTQHKQEAATEETDQLSNMPLSQIAMDDSNPPIVHYGTHMPTATSTPTGTDVQSSQQEDSYQQIIPGIPQGSLYPTLSSLSSEAPASKDEVQSLCDKVSKSLDKYLQDAEQARQSSECNPLSAKQKSIEETDSTMNIPESLKIDTSHTSRHLSTNDNELHQQLCGTFKIDYLQEMDIIMKVKSRLEHKINITLQALLPNKVVQDSRGPPTSSDRTGHEE